MGERLKWVLRRYSKVLCPVVSIPRCWATTAPWACTLIWVWHTFDNLLHGKNHFCAVSLIPIFRVFDGIIGLYLLHSRMGPTWPAPALIRNVWYNSLSSPVYKHESLHFQATKKRGLVLIYLIFLLQCYQNQWPTLILHAVFHMLNLVYFHYYACTPPTSNWKSWDIPVISSLIS